MSIKEGVKLEILKRLEGGESINTLTNEYGVSRSSIYQWRNENKSQPISNFNISARKFYLLRKEVESLRQTVKIYDATQCVKTTPLSAKLDAMKKVEKEFSHKALCVTLNVKKGTFLNHLYRKVEKTQVQLSDEIYKVKLLELFYLHNEIIGSRKLYSLMKNEGNNCSRTRLMRLMKELDIKCKRAVRTKPVVIPLKRGNPDLRKS